MFVLCAFAGNKSVSIHSVIPDTNYGKVHDIPSPGVGQQIPNLNEATPIIAGTVTDGDIHNPVVISSSSTVAKVCDQVFIILSLNGSCDSFLLY